MSKLIVVEGNDGCGKSTLIDNMKKYLISRNRTVKTFSTPVCEEYRVPIRNLLSLEYSYRIYPCFPAVSKDRFLSMLFISDKLKALCEDGPIFKSLNEHEYTILDRFEESMIAYNRDYEPYVVNAAYFIREMILNMDCTRYNVYVSTPVSDCMKRIKNRNGDKEIFETKSHLEKIDNHFKYKFAEIREDAITNGKVIESSDRLFVSNENDKTFNIIVSGWMDPEMIHSYVSSAISLCDNYEE